MQTYVVIEDRNRDRYAARLDGEYVGATIDARALEIATTIAICDPGERIRVGIVRARDAGAARLMPDERDGNGGIVWFERGDLTVPA